MAYPLKVWDGTQWVQVSTSTQSNYAFATLNRWRKTMSGGEVSLTGTDDSGLTLAYTAGEEQVFINGTLIVRGADYVATDGANITGIAPLASGDIVEVHSRTMQNIANTYTQSAADVKFVSTVNNGMFIAKPTSVIVGSGSGSVGVNGVVAFSGVSSIAINGCFTSSYSNYLFIWNAVSSGSGDLLIKLRASGTDASANYLTSGYYYNTSGVVNGYGNGITNQFYAAQTDANFYWGGQIDLIAPQLARSTVIKNYSQGVNGFYIGAGRHNLNTQFDGFTISGNGSNLSGEVRVYGYNNGA